MAERLFKFFKRIAKDSGEDFILERSASLSYYALYALGPLLLLSLFVVSIFVEEENARQYIVSYFEGRFGVEAVPFFETLIENLLASETSWLFSIISFFVFVFGIQMFFNSLRRGFFDIFGVDFKRSKNIEKRIKNQVFYILYALLLFLMLFVVLVINMGSPIIYNITSDLFSEIISVGILNILVTFSIFTLSAVIFGLVYKILSVGKIELKSALLGGFLASVLMIILNLALSFYASVGVGHSFYGFAGALVAFLVWVHYAGLVLFIGAEVAKTNSRIDVIR